MCLLIRRASRKEAAEVVVDAKVSRVSVTRRDLQTLEGTHWINDVIMNVYLNLIVNRSTKDEDLPKVFPFNTFFLAWYQRGYDGVRKWTRRVDNFTYDILLVLFHEQGHWIMATVDLRVKQIEFLNSMGGRDDHCLEMLLTYLAIKSQDEKGIQLDIREWKLTHVQNLPQQKKSSDCGMFALKCGEYAPRDARIDFSQKDMPFLRQRAMFEILQSAFIPPEYGET